MYQRQGDVEDAAHPPSILYAHPSCELYGSDRMAAETVLALSRHFRTTLTIPTDGPLAALMTERGVVPVENTVAVLRKADLSRGRVVQAVGRHLLGVVRAARQIRRSGCSTVYVNTITQPAWILAARLLHKDVICHVRENEEALPRPIRLALVLPLLLAHVIIANSRATARFVAEQFPVLGRATTVVPNGKDWTPYYRSDFTMQAPAVRLVVVGRLSPRKGQDVALAALTQLVHRGIDARMVLAGDTFPGYETYADMLHVAASDEAIAGRVRLVGFYADVAPLLEEADIVLVPSRIEPFGTVALEAMAAHRVVIASDVQGLREIVQNGETGFLVPPDDPDGLARCVAAVVDDPATARRVADRAFAHVRETYDSAAYADRIVEIVGRCGRRST